MRIGPLEPLDAPITLVEYDPAWPSLYARESARIRTTLGDRVLLLEHVGSTSVPHLAAKPRIDIVLVGRRFQRRGGVRAGARGRRLCAAHPRTRLARASPLQQPGYGRQPPRLLGGLRRDRTPVALPRSPAMRRSRPAALQSTKRDLAKRTWRHIQHYADAKTAVVEEILGEPAAPVRPLTPRSQVSAKLQGSTRLSTPTHHDRQEKSCRSRETASRRLRVRLSGSQARCTSTRLRRCPTPLV